MPVYQDRSSGRGKEPFRWREQALGFCYRGLSDRSTSGRNFLHFDSAWNCFTCFSLQLIVNPAILFCDEPTTGLDAFMAEQVHNRLHGWTNFGEYSRYSAVCFCGKVVHVLQQLARQGKTIICVIHQPASMFSTCSLGRALEDTDHYSCS